MQHGDATFDGFGQRDPRDMPRHLFWDARHIDYATAVRADISKQDFTICPRHWYVDAASRCARCGKSFVFSAAEQKAWYEELKFYVDSLPKRCQACRRELRELKRLRQEYDHDIVAALAGDAPLEEKQRLIAVVDALDAGGIKLPDKLLDNRRVLARQIEKFRPPDAG